MGSPTHGLPELPHRIRKLVTSEINRSESLPPVTSDAIGRQPTQRTGQRPSLRIDQTNRHMITSDSDGQGQIWIVRHNHSSIHPPSQHIGEQPCCDINVWTLLLDPADPGHDPANTSTIHSARQRQRRVQNLQTSGHMKGGIPKATSNRDQRFRLSPRHVPSLLDLWHRARCKQSGDIHILIYPGARTISLVHPGSAIHNRINRRTRPPDERSNKRTDVEPSPTWSRAPAMTTPTVVQIERIHVHADSHACHSTVTQALNPFSTASWYDNSHRLWKPDRPSPRSNTSSPTPWGPTRTYSSSNLSPR